MQALWVVLLGGSVGAHFSSPWNILIALCMHFGSSCLGILRGPTLVVPGTSDTLTDAWQFLLPSAYIETVFLHRHSPLAFLIGRSLIKLLPAL